MCQLKVNKGVYLTEIGSETSPKCIFLCRCAKSTLPVFPTSPAGVSGSLVSPLCDALVPHSLHFPALLGLCLGCLGSHHSARYGHTHKCTNINVQVRR